MSVFVATPQRRQAAQRARRTVLIIAIVLFVGAIAALIAFPPGTGTRLTLTGASLVLAVLAVLMLAARYHEDRVFEGTQAAMPFSVSALIERWRSVRVLGGRGRSRGRL